MKKFGFTLAEVLITLGIIGTIAAITLPTLMTDTTSAQIGPKLAKGVAMFEQANEAMLNANSVDTLSDRGLIQSVAGYETQLMRYLKGSIDGNGYFLTKDNIQYRFTITNNNPNNFADPGHLQRIGNVIIDLTPTSDRDTKGLELFYFSWWNDGSLRPKGARNWEPGGALWTAQCPKAEDGVVNGNGYEFCAGHIFENNLKVLYR